MVNRVVINGEVKLDLTGDTVTADELTEGTTAHDASGRQIVGTLVGIPATKETWTFTLEDGSTVTKTVLTAG